MSAELEINEAEPFPEIPKLFRYLSELSPQPMVAVDGTTHVVTYANPAFVELVGTKLNQLIGHPFAEAVPEGAENRCLALLDRVFRTGVAEKLPEQEHRQTRPGVIYWSYTMWAILGPDERPVGVMVQVTDTTEMALFRRQAVAINESLLVSASRQHELTETAESLSARLQIALESRDQFLAVLSHELRNPLTVFSSGLHLLKLSAGDRSMAEKSRRMMERQFKQMVRLVDDLLDVSRIATGKLRLHKERVELATVIRDAVEASGPTIDNRGHRLIVSLPPTQIFLDADPVRIVQVFLNLLDNAAKYSEACREIKLTATLDGNVVEVSVQDQGIGIPNARVPHIFEAFTQVDTSWQRTQGGMGIGLSLVREFVQLHGGRVEIRSMGFGQGSEFLVRLPVATVAAEEPSVTAEEPLGPRRRILVVDDNEDAAESLAMSLEVMGHQVLTTYDGETAVAMAAEFRPELILLDLGMPIVDGYEAARRIRAERWGAQLFLVAVSGWGTEDDRRRTQKGGFDRHLAKPVDTIALARLIAELPIKSA
jgi:PAS domain S-box-containing protein